MDKVAKLFYAAIMVGRGLLPNVSLLSRENESETIFSGLRGRWFKDSRFMMDLDTLVWSLGWTVLWE
jgi:hypothetical protein